jgi:hypothetical protein
VRASALRTLGALSLVAASLWACGKKGDPLPPLQIVPAAVTDLSAALSGGEITLAFTVPAADPNDPVLVAPERIEIYRLDTPPGGKPPAVVSAVGQKEYLRGEIAVRPPEAVVPAGAPAAAPAPGERATFVEPLEAASTAESRTYVTVGVVGRSRRGPTAVVTVPLATLPPPPQTITATNDERSLILTWESDGKAFRVFSVADASGSSPTLVTPKPITEARFAAPVEFGRERCFTVRTVLVADAATVEGPPSSVQCLTAVDRYPPPAPTGLRAIQEGTAIALTWNPSDAADLAGYVVLRGDASGTDLQPLVKAPIRELTYQDSTVQPGATYTYSVYAVDSAATPNVSQLSDRQLVTVR